MISRQAHGRCFLDLAAALPFTHQRRSPEFSDLYSIPVDKVKDVKIVRTVVGGKMVHGA